MPSTPISLSSALFPAQVRPWWAHTQTMNLKPPLGEQCFPQMTCQMEVQYTRQVEALLLLLSQDLGAWNTPPSLSSSPDVPPNKCANHCYGDRNSHPSCHLLFLQTLLRTGANIINVKILPWSWHSPDPNYMHSSLQISSLTFKSLPQTLNLAPRNLSIGVCQCSQRGINTIILFLHILNGGQRPQGLSSLHPRVLTPHGVFGKLLNSASFMLLPQSLWGSLLDLSPLFSDMWKYHVFLEIISTIFLYENMLYFLKLEPHACLEFSHSSWYPWKQCAPMRQNLRCCEGF